MMLIHGFEVALGIVVSHERRKEREVGGGLDIHILYRHNLQSHFSHIFSFLGLMSCLNVFGWLWAPVPSSNSDTSTERKKTRNLGKSSCDCECMCFWFYILFALCKENDILVCLSVNV